MKKVVIAIYDKAAGVYTPPTYMRSKAEAIRSFTDHVQDETQIINKHPEQFVLYELGTFDDETGVFEGTPNPLIPAIECLDIGRASENGEKEAA